MAAVDRLPQPEPPDIPAPPFSRAAANKIGCADSELASGKIWTFGQLEPDQRLCDIASPAGTGPRNS